MPLWPTINVFVFDHFDPAPVTTTVPTDPALPDDPDSGVHHRLTEIVTDPVPLLPMKNRPVSVAADVEVRVVGPGDEPGRRSNRRLRRRARCRRWRSGSPHRKG